ncbi:TatD family hydrolase [Niallia sp. Krafla_26]|uniref:TatD family hydrolase n=1 Tax=Niallia sp. Krafla_26 TaxID=3064703 RepID=UPI003D1837E0
MDGACHPLKMIDAHIHLDQYKNDEIEKMLTGSDEIEGLVTVSFDLQSCKRNLQLSNIYQKVKSAFGFHPEQNLPTDEEMNDLIEWMRNNQEHMVAFGEVGLPYYLRQDGEVTSDQYRQYMELLEVFIRLAKRVDKPIVLHAIYEDAPVVCDLLERHSVTKAHFHWFKGDDITISRMAENGYFISVTPEIVYKEKIQKLVTHYPLEQIMVETDGPWPFEGPFTGKMTHPQMMSQSIEIIARLKQLSKMEMAEIIHGNTKAFYNFQKM